MKCINENNPVSSYLGFYFEDNGEYYIGNKSGPISKLSADEVIDMRARIDKVGLFNQDCEKYKLVSSSEISDLENEIMILELIKIVFILGAALATANYFL